MILLTDVVSADEVVKEVSQLATYVEGKIPAIMDFAIGVILSLVVYAIGARVIKWVRKLLKKSLDKSTLDVGVQQFLDSIIKLALHALLIFSILQKYGLDTATVAAALASCGVAIGLALQGSLSNFAGGVLILVLRPFVVGDYIIEDSNKCEGVVKEIQMFYTKLQTGDNQTIIIPNGALANNSLTNVTAQANRRLDLKVDISYDADIKKAKAVLEKLLANDEGILQDKDKIVYVDQLGASSVVIGVRGWVAKENYWTTRWRLLENMKLALDENGIEIPYNQIVVHTKEEK